MHSFVRNQKSMKNSNTVVMLLSVYLISGCTSIEKSGQPSQPLLTKTAQLEHWTQNEDHSIIIENLVRKKCGGQLLAFSANE